MSLQYAGNVCMSSSTVSEKGEALLSLRLEMLLFNAVPLQFDL